MDRKRGRPRSQNPRRSRIVALLNDVEHGAAMAFAAAADTSVSELLRGALFSFARRAIREPAVRRPLRPGSAPRLHQVTAWLNAGEHAIVQGFSEALDWTQSEYARTAVVRHILHALPSENELDALMAQAQLREASKRPSARRVVS
jgi:hypothetical protein